MQINEQMKKKQFWVLFFIEMWERYAFYGFQSLFMLFITYQKFPQKEAYLIFGIFTALLWMMPTIGGYLADKFFGHQRALILGGIIFALGYTLLGLASHIDTVYLALSVIAVGNGFFKPIPSAMIANIYKDNSEQSKSAFTVYYMSIQIGGLTAIAFSPQIAAYLGYSVAYFLCAAGMLIGLANYAFKYKLMRYAGNRKDQQSLNTKTVLIMCITIFTLISICLALFNLLNVSVYLVSILGVIILCILVNKAKKDPELAQRIKQYIGILLIIESISFWIIYNQMFSTFMLFAQKNIGLTMLGLSLQPGNIVLFDGIGVLIMSSIIIYFYKFLARKNYTLNIVDKFAIGQIFTGLSVLILALACIGFGSDGQISIWWMALVFVFFTIGEVLISALGLAMASLYFPNKMVGFAMGVWFLAQSIAGVLTGKFASLFASIPESATQVESMSLYIKYFLQLAVISIILGIVYYIIAIVIKKATRKIIRLP